MNVVQEDGGLEQKKELNKIAMPQPWQAIAQRFCSIPIYEDKEMKVEEINE